MTVRTAHMISHLPTLRRGLARSPLRAARALAHGTRAGSRAVSSGIAGVYCHVRRNVPESKVEAAAVATGAALDAASGFVTSATSVAAPFLSWGSTLFTIHEAFRGFRSGGLPPGRKAIIAASIVASTISSVPGLNLAFAIVGTVVSGALGVGLYAVDKIHESRVAREKPVKILKHVAQPPKHLEAHSWEHVQRYPHVTFVNAADLKPCHGEGDAEEETGVAAMADAEMEGNE